MQASGGYRLIVRRGPQPNQVYELTKDVITLGRDITNDIVVNDPEVSRHHSRLTRTPNGYTLEDLGSTNGTFVNGQRLSAARPLNNGDMVGMGETVTMAYEGAAVGQDQTLPNNQMQAGEAGQQQQQQQPPAYQPPPFQQPPPYGGQPQQQQPPFGAQQQVFGQPQQQQQPPYGPQQQAYAPQQQQQPYGGQYPPEGGYQEADYGQPDAYYPQEAEGNDMLRYVLLGCGFLVVLCMVLAVVVVVVIDIGNLWCDIPLGPQIVEIIGGQCPVP